MDVSVKFTEIIEDLLTNKLVGIFSRLGDKAPMRADLLPVAVQLLEGKKPAERLRLFISNTQHLWRDIHGRDSKALMNALPKFIPVYLHGTINIDKVILLFIDKLLLAEEEKILFDYLIVLCKCGIRFAQQNSLPGVQVTEYLKLFNMHE